MNYYRPRTDYKARGSGGVVSRLFAVSSNTKAHRHFVSIEDY